MVTLGIFALVCFTALVFFGFHKVFHKPTEEPKDDDGLSAVAAHECLQEDEEKRESWLDELDRSTSEDPWDSDNEDDY